MFFSNSLEDTDRKGTDCCEQCKKRLQSVREDASLAQNNGGVLWLL
jgi:predicted Zn-dependent protease